MLSQLITQANCQKLSISVAELVVLEGGLYQVGKSADAVLAANANPLQFVLVAGVVQTAEARRQAEPVVGVFESLDGALVVAPAGIGQKRG